MNCVKVLDVAAGLMTQQDCIYIPVSVIKVYTSMTSPVASRNMT